MRKLTELLAHIDILDTKGDVDIIISSISLNSKSVDPNSIFVALVGNATDGHLYIEQAIDGGALAILYEEDPKVFKDGITYIKAFDTHDALGRIASAFYGHPSEKLKLIGVTGTNGKTTVATLLHSLFRGLGHKAGMIGTVVNKINDMSFEAIRTTPDPIALNKLLSSMVTEGCSYCFMEVSSHAVSEKRIMGLSFAGSVFTNLTQDHLDYHQTIENYRDAKKKFFDDLSEASFALSNHDDPNGEYMLRDTKAKKYFYSLKNDTDLPEGKADFTERLETKLIGEFNAYNALAIYGAAVALGEDPSRVREVMKKLEPVPGRFQYFKNDKGVTGIVDYAHTPDALENVLRTVNDMKKNGRIISVFGCGGDRDRTKRPIMARIGYDMSDAVILTSDNPRSEDPDDILIEMKKGIEGLPEDKVFLISDRKEAIQKACFLARTGDYILIVGKGHENYQEVKGIKSHFDDIEELKKCLLQ
ncbi:MAG: UDP-N-acetylmuramoyl-L-alanyl-D-glutamate--2,6-diaminopimelate ligase [Patescibacteria group bacterium]